MKSRIKEQGSTLHIVIIIVLVLAVLGLLGFVFWQNFMNKPVATTDTSKENTTASQRSITIPEWGVKGSYTYTKDLDYSFVTTGTTFLELTTRDIYNNDTCNKGSTGAITRHKADELVYQGVGSPGVAAQTFYSYELSASKPYVAKAHVGDYYYFMESPQDFSCMDEDKYSFGKEADAVYSASMEFVKSLESSK